MVLYFKRGRSTTNGYSPWQVGARIMTEVLVGLLEGDNSSFITQNPFWKPTLPCCEPYRNNKHFTVVDLTRIAQGKVQVSL